MRPAESLQRLVEADPFAGFGLPPAAKLVVTFLRAPVPPTVRLPVEQDGAIILKFGAAEVLTAYVPSPKGAVFMRLLERTFGTDITTRTLETVRKCAEASLRPRRP